jgi:Fe-S cluster biogenesis protein NfuA
MSKTPFFLCAFFLGLGSPIIQAQEAGLPLHAESVPAPQNVAGKAYRVPPGSSVVVPKRFVLEPLESGLVERTVQARREAASAAAEGVFVVAVPHVIGLGREVLALKSASDTRAQLDWQLRADGSHATALAISSPDAVAIRLGVRVFNLPDQTIVRVHAPAEDDAEEVEGREIVASIARNIAAGEVDEAAHMWWAPSIDGEEAVLEIVLPAGVAPESVDIAIPRIAHRFNRELEEKAISSCETDVGRNSYVCSDTSAWDTQSRATAKMQFIDGASWNACTGTLLKDTQETKTPWFLSANHCISTQTVASTLETLWLFYSKSCGDSMAADAANWGTLSYIQRTGGAELLYHSANNDMSFMRLLQTPPVEARYADWSTSMPTAGSALVGVHHPQGSPQRISKGTRTTNDNYYCYPDGSGFVCTQNTSQTLGSFPLTWNEGITVHGSSGSGVFNSDKKLVGTLYGGWCGSGSAGSYYGRFDVSFDAALHQYLDPQVQVTRQLNIQLAGSGHGRITGNSINCTITCSQSYTSDTTVTLTATADTDSVFSGWSGGCSGTSSCTLTVNAIKNVTATFTLKPRLTVNFAGTGGGTITGNEGFSCAAGTCSKSYTSGTTVKLTATAATGSVFSGWSGACSGTSSCTLTVNADKSVTATFNPLRQLNIKLAGLGKGRITGTDIDCSANCSKSYTGDTTVKLTATADTDSVFSGWSGGTCSGTATTCTVTVNAVKDVTATFNPKPKLTVTISAAGLSGGIITGNEGFSCTTGTCSKLYAPSTKVTLTAKPDSNSVFSGWGGACTGTATCTVTMDGIKNVTAAFSPVSVVNPPISNTLRIEFAGSGAGTITGAKDGDCSSACYSTYTSTTLVTLTAVAAKGSVFAGWTGACSGTATTCKVTVDGSKAVTAIFNLDNTPTTVHTLSVTFTGSGSGTITGQGIGCSSDCAEQYTSDTQVTLTANPAAGSVFSGWSGDCSGTATTCVITVDASKNVTVLFESSGTAPASQIVLRDAIYLFNQPVYGTTARAKTLAGYHCDVFQLLLNVQSGYTDLAGLEGSVASGPTAIYPDRINSDVTMFSYMLYSANPVKFFSMSKYLAGTDNGQIGTVTVFGYCFSSRTDAKVLLHDNSTGTCLFSNGQNRACATVPNTLPQ